MLDIRQIRQDPSEVEKRLKTKDPTLSLRAVIDLDHRIRELKGDSEALKAQRNDVSKEIGAMRKEGKSSEHLIETMSAVREQIQILDDKLSELEESFNAQMSAFPQLPMASVPVASSEKDNVELRRVGKPPSFSFTPKHHLDIAQDLRLVDFKRSAKITGSGWPLFTGMGARLEWSLLNFMIEKQIAAGFEMYMIPHLVRRETMYGVGQLPKFANQLFRSHDEDFDLYLIPTAEAALGGLYSDEILAGDSLPKRLFSYSPCFRREAGAAGTSDRGLIRTHQFNKVEMFAFSHPKDSEKIFEEMVALAEEILSDLELPYRVIELVTGDMPFSSAKTYDLEVWLPGQGRYYECSSISNCLDFQARRSKTRFKEEPNSSPEFVHTLNGSGLATSRVMCALLENNQQKDGSIVIPKVLRPYLHNIERI